MSNKMQGSGMAIAISIGFAVAIGIATDNLVLWLCFGVACGAAFLGSADNTTENDEDASAEEPSKD